MSRQPRRLAGIGAEDIPNSVAFDSYVGPARELTVDPTRRILALHDGVTEGGIQFSQNPSDATFAEYNIKNMGVKGDGSDEHVAIQAAINAVAATGGTLVWPEGTYGTSRKLISPNTVNNVSGVQMRSCGRFATLLKALPPFDGDCLFELKGLTDVSGFYFDGNGQPIFAIANRMTGGEIMPIIERNFFTGFPSPGGAYLNDTKGCVCFQENFAVNVGTAISNTNWGTVSLFRANQLRANGDCVFISNNGDSNEGLIFSNNYIGSVSGHGIVIAKGLDIIITDNEITPIQAYASGKRGIVFTGPSGPVRIRGNWIEGLLAHEMTMAEIDISDNYFPNGMSLHLEGIPPALLPAGSRSIYNCKIKGNRFNEGVTPVTSSVLVVQNVANVDVLENDVSRVAAAGAPYMSGNIDVRWAWNRFNGLLGGDIGNGNNFAFNRGGSGYSQSYNI